MLVLKEVLDVHPERIMPNSYSFTIFWEQPGKMDTVYWRTGNAEREGLKSGVRMTLLEIGVHPKTGRILVFEPSWIEEVEFLGSKHSSLGHQSASIMTGTPSFDISMFQQFTAGRYVYEYRVLGLKIGSYSIRYEFAPSDATISCVKSGDVSFGFNSQDELIAVEIDKLSDEQIERILTARDERIQLDERIQTLNEKIRDFRAR